MSPGIAFEQASGHLVSLTNIKCKVCQTSSNFVCSNPNGHGRIPAIHTFRCPKCGIAFVGNPITSRDLSEAYSREGIDDYYAEIYEENHKKHLTAARAVKRILADDIKAPI